jgi:ABC-type phosphate transport system ATPase subunit
MDYPGQQQRLCISRAGVQPEVILMDESTQRQTIAL